MSFYKVDCNLQKYRHLQISFTYDIIDVFLPRTINDMVSKFFGAKREMLILLPVKVQLQIISESAIFVSVKRGVAHSS